MIKWFRKSHADMYGVGMPMEVKNISKLIMTVEKYGHDDIKRKEAIMALGEAVSYWSGYRFGTADKDGIRTLMHHFNTDSNQSIRLAAGQSLGQLRGLVLDGDTILTKVDIDHLSCFQKEELEGVYQAQDQNNLPLLLERIENILMLPVEASQPDHLIQNYINNGGNWPMDNRPTTIAIYWLTKYLENLDAKDRQLAKSCWIDRGAAMYNIFASMNNNERFNTTAEYRRDTVEGLIYVGITHKIFWNNADVVGIAASLLWVIAQGNKHQYEEALKYIAHADKLNPKHMFAPICRQMVEIAT